MTKRFTVAVGIYPTDETSLRAHSYASPKPIFAYDTNAPKQASRVLAELINGKTRRARDVRAQQPVGHGAKFVILADDATYSLNQFRNAFLR